MAGPRATGLRAAGGSQARRLVTPRCMSPLCYPVTLLTSSSLPGGSLPYISHSNFFFFLIFSHSRYVVVSHCGFKMGIIYLFIFGCVGSSFLCEGLLQLRRAGATLHRGARASHYRGLSCCRAQAPDVQAQWLWLTGPAAPRHVGSSWTRA